MTGAPPIREAIIVPEAGDPLLPVGRVPLLVRTILTLQRAGVERCTLVGPLAPPADPRIRCALATAPTLTPPADDALRLVVGAGTVIDAALVRDLQARARPGQVLEVDRLKHDRGSEVTLGRVLMLVDGERVTAGTPIVPGARVTATVLGHGRRRKIIVGKFRSKKRYRRRVGHRQPISRVRVERIDVEGPAHGA